MNNNNAIFSSIHDLFVNSKYQLSSFRICQSMFLVVVSLSHAHSFNCNFCYAFILRCPSCRFIYLMHRQTKSYLKFLSLCDIPYTIDDKFDMNSFSHDSGDIVHTILGLNDNVEGHTKPSSIILNRRPHSEKLEDNNENTANVTVHQSDTDNLNKLKILLTQEDQRGIAEPKMQLHQKVKKFTNTSKELLSKKISVLKVKANADVKQTQPLSRSLDSHTSAEPLRYMPGRVAKLAANEIKDFFRCGFFRHSHQHHPPDGAGMATLLVRTVMSPAEEAASASAQKNKEQPDVHTEVATHIAHTSAEVMKSDGNLSSNFSGSTCSIMSSSDEGGRRGEHDEAPEIVLIDADTVSMVVKSVLAQDEAQQDEYRWIRPSTHVHNNNEDDTDDEDIVDIEHQSIVEPRRLFRNASFHETGLASSDLRKSIKTGATRIVGPAKRGCHTQAFIMEKEANQKMWDDLLSTNPDDTDEIGWIQPGSTTDEPDYIETRRGSLFHDLRENISEKFHSLQEHMHHGKEHNEIKDRHGLLATAMDTMLIEQAEMLGVQFEPPPAFNDLIKQNERTHSSESMRSTLHFPFRKRTDSNCRKKPSIKASGLVDVAMKTMLVETANIIEGVGIHPAERPKIPDTSLCDLSRAELIQLSERSKQNLRRSSSLKMSTERQTLPKVPPPSPFPDRHCSAATSLSLPSSIAFNAASNNRNQNNFTPATAYNECRSDPIHNCVSVVKPNINSFTHHHHYHPHHHQHHAKELCISPFNIYKSTGSSKNDNSHNVMSDKGTRNNNKTNQSFMHATNSCRNGNFASPPYAYARHDSAHTKESLQSPTRIVSNVAFAVPGSGDEKGQTDPTGRRLSDSELSETPKGMNIICIAMMIGQSNWIELQNWIE